MRRAGFRIMHFRILFLAGLISAGPLGALTPADRVPADIAFYAEGSPLTEGLNSLRTLVSSVAGEGVWSLMAANIEQKAGMNLLDPAKLEELGINTRASWGLGLNVEIETMGTPTKPEFVMIIPVQANTKFYDFLKAKITEGQMPLHNELEPGKLFHFGSENDPGYLLRHEDALLVSNNLEMVKRMAGKASPAVSGAQFYTAMRSHLWSRNGGKQPMAAFFVNPRLIISSLKAQTEMLRQLQKELNQGGEQPPVMDENSPYVAEIRENLESSGGAMVATADRLSLYFSYKYKEGYLNDTSKIYPRILQVKTAPLASDKLARNPLLYTLLKINVAGLIDLFKSMSPVFTEKYAKAMTDFKTSYQIDFERDVIGTLRGNFNFHALNIPPEPKSKEITAWEIYGAFGIKNGSKATWLKLFKTTEKIAKKAEANKQQKAKFTYEEADEGDFVLITSEERIGGKKKPVTVVFLLRDDEIIVSNSKANAIKATKSAEGTLSERLTRLSYDAAQGIFFLDLQQIFKAAMKTKQGTSLKNYANMIEKMKFFSIISSIQGDFATAETTLQLRKPVAPD